ncbi:MAG: hypothetical protein CMP57_04750 [Flavobacteriales bacterium]|nr:hypothetical protein [Flavobacteriales bacterium]|tara:strand:+ start:19012 stop:19719 length:708 start_codon:yes stop_codon:yes gene_type:complete
MSIKLIFVKENFTEMRNTIFILLILVFSAELRAQKKSKFKTVDKNSKITQVRWNGNISYGNTNFIGDLNINTQRKFLPNIALSLKLNKEFSTKNSLQFGLITGRNSGENTPNLNTPFFKFRSQFTQAYIAYRKALTAPSLKNIQIHLISGVGYHYGEIEFTSEFGEVTSKTPANIWSIVFPIGLEMSYYIKEDWGVILSFTDQMFGRDNIDLYEDSSNGLDHQLILNLGFCFKFK